MSAPAAGSSADRDAAGGPLRSTMLGGSWYPDTAISSNEQDGYDRGYAPCVRRMGHRDARGSPMSAPLPSRVYASEEAERRHARSTRSAARGLLLLDHPLNALSLTAGSRYELSPVLAENIRPNVYPRKSNSPSGFAPSAQDHEVVGVGHEAACGKGSQRVVGGVS